MTDRETRGPRRRLAGAMIVGAAVLSLTRPVGAEEAVPELELVPHPDIEQLAPDVRDRLAPGVAFFRTQRSKLDGRELGLAYGRVGINYLAHGQIEAAGACLRNAGELDPANPRWPYLLGYLYQQEGRLAEAVEAYRHSLRIQNRYWQGFVRLGHALLELQRYEEAEAAFAAVLQRNANNAAGLAGAAETAYARGDYERAASLYQRALRIEPQASRLHDGLARSYAALGDEEAAARESAAAGDREPALEDPMLAFVEAHTRGAAHYLEAAREAEETGHPAMAIRFYEVATSLQPDDTESLLKLGELQGASGDLDGALATLARVTLFDPDNARANYFIGTILEQQGKEAEAARFYAVAVDESPHLVEPRLLLANSLMRRGAWREAGDHYARLAHQLPRNVDVQYLLGLAWLAAGECEWAHKVLARALAIEPGDGQVMTALTRAYSICPGATEEQRQQALGAATAMYERSPGAATAETLAMASAANGLYEDAIDLQTQAVFEAIRDGDKAEVAWLQQNMARYREGQQAERAWSPDAEVFRPRRLQVRAPTGAPAG